MNWLDEVIERAEKATIGPWSLDNPLNPIDISIWADKQDMFLANLAETGDGKYSPAFDIQRVADAEFIAHARTDVPELVKRLKRATNALRVTASYINNDIRCEHYLNLADELESAPESK